MQARNLRFVSAKCLCIIWMTSEIELDTGHHTAKKMEIICGLKNYIILTFVINHKIPFHRKVFEINFTPPGLAISMKNV